MGVQAIRGYLGQFTLLRSITANAGRSDRQGQRQSERALERLSRRCGPMATNYRRSVVRDGSRTNTLARLETARYAIAHRPSLVMVAVDGRLRDGQTATEGATRGTGPAHCLATGGPGSSRWDRFIARIARHRPPSPAVREADATFTAQIDRYNIVREHQGREPVRRDDFVDVLQRPPTTGGHDA